MSDDPFDQANRLAIVGLAMALIAAAGVVVALAWWQPDDAIARVEDFAGWLRDHNTDDGRLVLSLGAAVVILALLTLIVVELTPPDAQKMRVRNVKSGEAVISTAQIAERIKAEVQAVPHVAGCSALVTRHGKKVDIVLDLHVDAGADLADTADEACRRAHVLVEERMGIGLTARPRARLHYRELRLHARPSESPTREITGWEKPVHED
ncbi:MAG TPA: hypothetical protein VNM91_00710 [Dehalococcoidia bacterium]|nr:hypothetical protein [Dehalococcoidia bacterium]